MDNKENHINSLLIRYDISRTREYLCLSTFFSMCGFLVEGTRHIDEEKQNDARGCDVVIHLEVGLSQNEVDTPYSIYMSKAERCDGMISSVLHRLRKQNRIDDETCEILECVREIYVIYELRKIEYNGQFYFYIKNEVEYARKKYREAYSEVLALQRIWPDNPYLWFVRGQIIRRKQILASISGDGEPYRIGAVLEKLENVAKENSDFYTIYALMGDLSETSRDFCSRAEGYYWKCISLAPNPEAICLSSVYYRIGHWYDARNVVFRTEQFYQIAYELNNENFRALYKLARLSELKHENYHKAWQQYSEIQDLLEPVREEGYIQPIENEYLFKTYYCKWMLMQRGKIVYDGGRTELRLLNMDCTRMEDKKFFHDFYGTQANKYCGYMNDRLSVIPEKLQASVN